MATEKCNENFELNASLGFLEKYCSVQPSGTWAQTGRTLACLARNCRQTDSLILNIIPLIRKLQNSSFYMVYWN